MDRLGQSPYLWLEFDKGGTPRDAAVFQQLKTALADANATDLVVISHGWKNDREAALQIYEPLWMNTCAALNLDPTRIVVAGVLWPSVPHRDNIDEAALLAASEGGGLSSGSELPIEDVDDETFAAALADFLGDDPDPELSALAVTASQDLSSGESAQFVRAAVARVVGDTDEELREELETLVHLADDDPRGVLQSLVAKPVAPVDASVGGGLGIRDSVQKVFEGSKAAVTRLFGQLTYFDMKKRAGVVGASLGKHLAAAAVGPVRLHLVGHSFGARLVTAAATEIARAGQRVQTLTLLQGAFSHNALAPIFEGKPGAFADAVPGVDLITITHTHNDKACTLAYAIASRVSRDIATGIGGENDRFGSMGANGAQNVAAIKHVGTPGDPAIAPQKGRINNYRADAWIRGNPPGTDAHGDVSNPTVGKLLAAVLQA